MFPALDPCSPCYIGDDRVADHIEATKNRIEAERRAWEIREQPVKDLPIVDANGQVNLTSSNEVWNAGDVRSFPLDSGTPNSVIGAIIVNEVKRG